MGRATDIRTGLATLTLLSLGGFSASAQDGGDLTDLLADLSLWDQTFNLRLGAGYNDNLLLSDFNDESSPMISSGFDYTLFRLPVDGRHFNFFASVDDRRYPDGDQVRSEQTALVVAQEKRDLSEAWLGGLTGQYFYQNQVVDVSVTEADATTLPVQGHQLLGTTDWRWRSRSVWWVQADLSGQRQIFEEDLLDPYWQYGPRASAGFNYRNKSDVELSYELARRDYDTREQYSAAGVPLPGTTLYYLAQDVEAAWRHHFDPEQRWRLYSRLGWGRSQDNGSGYFNFDRFLAATQLRFRRGDWEAQLQVKATWYRYDVQVSDTDPTANRERLMLALGGRLERKISSAVRLVAQYDFEQATGNLSYDGYTANIVNLGIDWQF